MSTYTELKFRRERAWSKYFTALQSGRSEQECQQYWAEYEIINKEWKKEMGR